MQIDHTKDGQLDMQTKTEISIQEARFFLALKRAEGSWCTSKELADDADVSPHTARMYARRFTEMGLTEVARLYPGFRYRLSDKRHKNLGREYLSKLGKAVEAFGLDTNPGFMFIDPPH